MVIPKMKDLQVLASHLKCSQVEYLTRNGGGIFLIYRGYSLPLTLLFSCEVWLSREHLISFGLSSVNFCLIKLLKTGFEGSPVKQSTSF